MSLRLSLIICTAIVLPGAAQAQVQRTDFDSVVVTSTSAVAVDSITVDATGTLDVALTAHLYVEGQGFNPGRYDIGLCRGDENGPKVGRIFFRPRETAQPASFEGYEVSVTGFDAGVTGPVSYVLCAAKFDESAPDLVISLRGLNAMMAAMPYFQEDGAVPSPAPPRNANAM